MHIIKTQLGKAEMSEQEAMQSVIAELSEFTQQDDYLLAHGASLMSEDSFEIIHMDTVQRIIKTAFAAGRKLENEECAAIARARKLHMFPYVSAEGLAHDGLCEDIANDIERGE